MLEYKTYTALLRILKFSTTWGLYVILLLNSSCSCCGHNVYKNMAIQYPPGWPDPIITLPIGSTGAYSSYIETVYPNGKGFFLEQQLPYLTYAVVFHNDKGWSYVSDEIAKTLSSHNYTISRDFRGLREWTNPNGSTYWLSQPARESRFNVFILWVSPKEK